jgi:excisionase family DNA binding protein
MSADDVYVSTAVNVAARRACRDRCRRATAATVAIVPNQNPSLRGLDRPNSRDVQWLTLGQAATYLGVADSTVRKWAVEGRLTAYTTPGGHRRFRIADLDSFLEESRIAPPEHERPTVLIVDDDERQRAIVRFALEEEGYAVREAPTAAEGLAAIEEESPDLILLDVLMRDFDGWEVLCRLRDTHGLETVPVLIFAGRDPAAPRRTGRGGVKGFVGAGASPGAIVEAAKRVLGPAAARSIVG